MHLSAWIPIHFLGGEVPRNRSCNSCTSLLIETNAHRARITCEAASEFAKIPRDRDKGSSRMSRIARNRNALVPAIFDSLGPSRVSSSVRLMSAVETVSRLFRASEWRIATGSRLKSELSGLRGCCSLTIREELAKGS